MDLSALLPVRNWALDRVEMCCRSLLRSEGVAVEVVLLDYGSDNGESIAKLAHELGVVHARVESDEWSRSRAMNAAADLASGRVLLFVDADAYYSPHVAAETVRLLDEEPNRVLLFQCRDLPSKFTPDQLLGEVDLGQLDREATWRPRWGMGLQAMTRDTFLEIRGFDNRMTVYGGEDNDIVKRARAAGRRAEWMSSPSMGVYHVWHPSSRQISDQDPRTAAIIRENARIAHADPSRIRNLTTWSGPRPLVSVVITTYNRAEFLRDSINSVLAQTVQDFEVLILDDGSEDNTSDVVRSFDDPRIRYFPMEKSSIPTLRNFALEHSRGQFTAIHDDDDIMLPWSLESRLKALEGGVAGSYGGAFNFDNETGELDFLPGRDATLENLLVGGKVFLHATLLIETQALRSVRYDDSFRSGSDYNLAARMLRCGYQLSHSHEVVLLRRLHPRQVTTLDETIQHGASYATSFSTRATWSDHARSTSNRSSKDAHPVKYHAGQVAPQRVLPYLPDHLVVRSGLFLSPPDNISAHRQGSYIRDGETQPVWFVSEVPTTAWDELRAAESTLALGARLKTGEFSEESLLEATAHSLHVNAHLLTVNRHLAAQAFAIGHGLTPAAIASEVRERPNSALLFTGIDDDERELCIEALEGS